MPNLSAITSVINSALKANSFSSNRFQAAQYNNIAYLISETTSNASGEVTIKRPMAVDNFGEGTDVTIDDTFALQVYHRNLALNYLDDKDNSVGDPGDEIREVADMIMICIGDRAILKVVQEDVAAAIWEDMPRNLTKAQLQSNTLELVVIEPGEVNVNPEEVYNQEYQGVKYQLKPNNFMLSVKYKITTDYRKACFKLCK
jgi:hypothetical protein